MMRVVDIFSQPKGVDVSRTHRDLILITDGENKEEACYDAKLLVTYIRLKMKAFPLRVAVEATRPNTHHHKTVCTNTHRRGHTGVAVKTEK